MKELCDVCGKKRTLETYVRREVVPGKMDKFSVVKLCRECDFNKEKKNVKH